MNNIIIIGMAGVGKTTVGKLLAEKLGMDFFDLDRNIELRCGVEVSRIFEIEGESGFRNWENNELQRIFNTHSGFILSVGGGCVAQSANREILIKHHNLIIQLYADINIVFNRITKSPSKRPLFSNVAHNSYNNSHNNSSSNTPNKSCDLIQTIDQLYQSRKAYYDNISDIILNTSFLRPNQVVDKIIESINFINTH